MDCSRNGKVGIKGMLHKECGAGYNPTYGTPAPLVDDMVGVTMISPWTLGIVEVGDGTNDVSLPIDMIML